MYGQRKSMKNIHILLPIKTIAMALFKSSNPALNAETFKKVIHPAGTEDVMTIQGTVNKTALLGLIVFASALYTWNLFYSALDPAAIYPYAMGGAIGGLVVAFIIIFKKTLAPYLAPVYCLLEGLLLGGLSAIMNLQFPGIVLQAILLTFGILFSLLFLYRLRIIKVTENFKLIVASATMGIAFYYLISFGARLIFSYEVPFIHESTTGGIIFSLVVVAIAAMNLVVDFDFIEQGAEQQAPKYMEWYAAFGLMVTIIWLYIELLRLLSKMRKK